MKSTRQQLKPQHRLTALIAGVLWLFSSTAAFLLPGIAHALADDMPEHAAQGHEALHAVDSEQVSLSRVSPCPNHRQDVDTNSVSDTQNTGSPHGNHCAEKCAMSGCSGTVVALLSVTQNFAVYRDVKALSAVFQSVQFLPPDQIYRPPQILVA